MRWAWRILENKGGIPHTLMHPHLSNRSLPLDEWLDAWSGMGGKWPVVYNPGSRNGATPYHAGWHHMVGAGAEEALVKYMKRFTRKRDLVICHIQVDDENSWPKPGPNNIMLSRLMRIPRGSWRRATLGETI